MSTTSTPADSPIQSLHGQQAQIQVPQAPLGKASGLLNAKTSSMGTKALLAKKMAKNKKPAFHSPTDNMLTPCSAKLNQTKKKHFEKSKHIRPIFSQSNLIAADELVTIPVTQLPEVADEQMPETKEDVKADSDKVEAEDIVVELDTAQENDENENPFKN